MSIRYFLFLKEENNAITEEKKKDITENVIEHIHFVPDTYSFMKDKKFYNITDVYDLYIKQILILVETCLANNVPIVSLELFSKETLEFMTYDEIEHLVHKNEFWNFFIEYQNQANIILNFYYSETIPLSLKKRIGAVTEAISNPENKQKINILIGFDMYYELDKKISTLLDKSTESVETKATKKIFDIEGIRGIIQTIIPPIDISFIFNNGQVSSASLATIFHNDIIHINYSIQYINAKKINLLLKNYYFLV